MLPSFLFIIHFILKIAVLTDAIFTTDEADYDATGDAMKNYSWYYIITFNFLSNIYVFKLSTLFNIGRKNLPFRFF